ncbi:hypothetical protein Z043_120573 [Scleropages formosus]|uniref:Uncharacterized protein n=1 Tax=Scleropages formosus TaxID=113540 RepID=A0A0P7WJ62_SCLFO|nr:hypothetical protein Z043_120573 [Scleropages formosus]
MEECPGAAPPMVSSSGCERPELCGPEETAWGAGTHSLSRGGTAEQRAHLWESVLSAQDPPQPHPHTFSSFHMLADRTHPSGVPRATALPVNLEGISRSTDGSSGASEDCGGKPDFLGNHNFVLLPRGLCKCSAKDSPDCGTQVPYRSCHRQSDSPSQNASQRKWHGYDTQHLPDVESLRQHLKEVRFFDLFGYSEEARDWLCFMCNNPEKATGILFVALRPPCALPYLRRGGVGTRTT